MEEKPKILVADDETQIIRVLRNILTAHHYDIQAASNGESALKMFRQWAPDLVLTDLQMPGIDGLSLCKQIRSTSQVPIIILSVRDDEATIVEALDLGADDYVTKPFSTNELLARIRSGLRRRPERNDDSVEVGDFKIDISAHDASVSGKRIRLTPKEFDLLVCLARNPERVLTHSFLLKNVWGHYYSEQADALRVLVGTLRKKIEPDPSNPRYLITEPWIGYRFLPRPS